ncbi:transcriptional regulator [Streptomyces sp. NRRL B-24484]|uniref:transcriptional regulator n=1 Tax=Streptomyces sp. NRRL B-24484 TaxID=1463833 RepID=UPI00069369DD|nr:transcriptional regulator [Streptomyces sp. NRRL B-24484]
MPSADLQQALRTGPFDLALRTAIRESGLGLEGIQRRLAGRGLQVSVSSLSYWQRGRSRPERTESLTVVRALEDVLMLRPDSLIVLLGPRRPRGRWINHVPGSIDYASTFGDPEVGGVLADLDPRNNARLENLHTRIDVHIGEHREEQRVDVLQVLRALGDGADRLVLLTRSDSSTDGAPGVTDLVGCRLGRRRTAAGKEGFAAAELLFDLPLQPGQATVIEYSYACPSSEVETQYERMVRFPSKNLVLRARFHPTMLPAGCELAWRPSHDAPPQILEELRISPTGQACGIVPEAEPGVHGLYWEWGDQPRRAPGAANGPASYSP